jgi:uncharacterized SAM-binding protein YcdF (DUF218 family)
MLLLFLSRLFTLLSALGFGAILGLLGVVSLGFVLDGPLVPLERSDAIVVISGDEAMARFREGLRLHRLGWGRALVFSGAAYDDSVSNAAVMRELAIASGVPAIDILTEGEGVDTLGNALNTRRLLEEHGLRSAILVTSPYHLRRAMVTFESVFAGSGIRVIAHSAPDSDWRKLTWWLRADTRQLTLVELQKLAYILATGRYR